MTSRLDHENGLPYGVSDNLVTQLQRECTLTKRWDRITPAVIELRWLPVRQRIVYKLLLLTFNSLRCLVALYLADLHKHCLLLAPFSTRHMQENSVAFTMLCVENKLLFLTYWARSLRSADAHLLVIPRSNPCTQGYRAFSHAAPRLWNNLPLAMRATDSHNIFKKQLKIRFYLNVHFLFKRHW